MPRKMGIRFKLPTVELKNDIISVNLGGIETTPFITMNNPTNSLFLKFSKARCAENLKPSRPNLNLSEMDYKTAEEALKKLYLHYKIFEKFKKAKLESNSSKKFENLVNQTKPIKKMLKEKFKISYISMILGIKENRIHSIKGKMSHPQKIYSNKRGRTSKISKDHLDILSDIFSDKTKGYGYLPARSALDKWLKLCELPSGYIKLRYFRKLLHEKLGLTYKKNSTFKEKGNSIKNKKYKQKFVMWNLRLIQQEKEFIFLDECGFNLEDHKLYGWNKKGEPLRVRQSIKSINYTVIGAITVNGIVGYEIIKGSLVSEIFVGFFCFLINHLSQVQNGKELNDYVFVLDNARAHLKFFTQYIRPGINVLWTPPYTPQLNPIEIIWSQWKRLVSMKES